MSERVARIRLMLNSGGLLAGLGQVGDSVVQLGSRMKAAFDKPAREGLAAMKSSIVETTSKARDLVGMAAGIAGGLSVGAGAQGAISLEDSYRELAFTVSQATGEATKWRDVQRTIEPVADAVNRTSKEMVAGYDALIGKTNNAQFSAQALGLVGEAMNATGRSAEELGTLVGTLNKKWGITDMGEVRQALMQLFEASKNIKFDELAEDLDEVGSIAKGGGMAGIDGFRRSLGLAAAIAPSTNRTFSEVLTGMDQLTEKMRQMPVWKGLAEAGRFAGKDFFDKFTAQPDAMNRVRMLLESAGKKGTLKQFAREAIEVEFTGREERAAYKVLADPFMAAFEEAQKAGKNTKEATEAGLKAFDAAIGKLGQTTMEWSQIQDRAADNQQAASAKIRQAQELWQRAFTDEKTLAAMDDLAQSLPKIASGMANLVKFAVDSPWLAGGALLGGKAALAGAGGFTGSLLKSGLDGLGSSLGMTASVGAKAAVSLGQIEKQSSLASRAVASLADASGLENVAGKGAAAASAATALVALGFAAYETTTKLLEMRDAEDQKGIVRANNTFFEVNRRMSEANTPEERAKILKEGEQSLTENIGFWESPQAASNSIKALRKNKEEMDFRDIKARTNVFEETMTRTADSGDKTGRALERAAASAEKLARVFDRIAPPAGSNGLPEPASNTPGYR